MLCVSPLNWIRIMVVRPPTIELDAETDMPTKLNSITTGQHTDKQRHSMSRKYVSMSPAGGGGVPRSKSMNGLNRIDANKINENGRTSNHSTRRTTTHRQQRDISSSENGSPNGLYNGWELWEFLYIFSLSLFLFLFFVLSNICVKTNITFTRGVHNVTQLIQYIQIIWKIQVAEIWIWNFSSNQCQFKYSLDICLHYPFKSINNIDKIKNIHFHS